ncbi:MAG: hypothetical protein CMJ64_11800, partial [Planctomycetaceae bacterium]|nr:hypothetical protein [Planctomycetaceae bacterium]
GTPSRVGGAEINILAKEALARHKKAYGKNQERPMILALGGHYHWRRGEEKHMLNPNSIWCKGPVSRELMDTDGKW